MTETALALYNLFMVICVCFISYQIGGIMEIRRQMRQNQEKAQEDLIRAYKQRG